jgi:hypothetical protein
LPQGPLPLGQRWVRKPAGVAGVFETRAAQSMSRIPVQVRQVSPYPLQAPDRKKPRPTQEVWSVRNSEMSP